MMDATDRQRLIQKLNKFEIECVTGNFISKYFTVDLTCQSSKEHELIQDLNKLMKSVVKHDYKEVVENDYSCLRPFKEVSKNLTLVFYEAHSEIKSNYQYLFHPKDEDCPYMKQLILLLIGIAALQEFVRVNMCGSLNSDTYNIYLLPDTNFSDASIIDALERDGEAILTNVAHPKLLYLSLLMLFGNNFDKCLTHKWWLIRCMMVYQKILPDTIMGLYQSLTSLIKSQKECFLNVEVPLARVMFYTECAQIHMYYHELNVAEKFLVSAQNVLGIGIQFKIAFKKHFSKKPDYGFVKMKRNDARYRSVVDDSYKLPELPDISKSNWEIYVDLIDSDGNKIKELLLEEQIILLAYCDLLGNWKQPFFTQEEDRPILKCLLSQRNIWSLQIKALVLLCQKRFHKNRKSDKLFLIKHLIFLVEQPSPSFQFRENMMYCASLPMSWELQKMYADALLNNELVDDALKIYEDNRLWEGAILCYKKSDDLMRQGIRMLEAQIAMKPSSLLWCYLGDLTNNPDIYLVAWNLSRHTNVRSKRALGLYYYEQNQYPDSCDHFQKSLDLNYLQPKVLLSMGRALLSLEEYGVAVRIFTQMLAMDTNNFEAWNSLTTAYIHMGQLKKACKSLVESQAFGCIDTFENSGLLSAKMGAFSRTIKLYRKFLSELESDTVHLSKINLGTLRILTDAVLKRIPDQDSVPSHLLKEQLIHVLKKIRSRDDDNKYLTVLEMYISLLNVGWDKPDFRTCRLILFYLEQLIEIRLANQKDTNQHVELVLQSLHTYMLQVVAYLGEVDSRFFTLKNKKIAKFKTFIHKTVDKIEVIQNRLNFSTKAQELLSVIKQNLKSTFQSNSLPSRRHIVYEF